MRPADTLTQQLQPTATLRPTYTPKPPQPTPTVWFLRRPLTTPQPYPTLTSDQEAAFKACILGIALSAADGGLSLEQCLPLVLLQMENDAIP